MYTGPSASQFFGPALQYTPLGLLGRALGFGNQSNSAQDGGNSSNQDQPITDPNSAINKSLLKPAEPTE